MLYLLQTHLKASPKAISRRTSYLRVRLEFHPYPQVIQHLFNDAWFGPPRYFTNASSCSWVDHPVSGLRHQTFALFRLAFASAPHLKCLTLPVQETRRTVLQKVRGHTRSASTVCKHKVSGSLSLPSRGPFHRSFTVLCAIGH